MAHHIITLYGSKETQFLTNGIGSLNEAKRCEVLEERNGEFELTMEYPVSGRHFTDLKKHAIIFAKPNPYDKAQPFRIYHITKPINGIVTVSAHHVSYDLSGYPIAAFTAKGLSGVFTEMTNNMSKPWNAGKQPFSFSHDKPDTAQSEFVLISPCNAKALLGGTDASILERFKGEYEWDRWKVILHENRGADRGAVISYGKNMTEFEQEEDFDNVWSGVYPFYYSDDNGLVELDTTDKIVKCPGEYEIQRIYILDLSSEFEEKPTAAQLKERAEKYISDNELGSPKVTMTLSFVDLANAKNYEAIKVLETVKLCDTIRVEFPKMKVSSTTKCISTKYDAIRDKYIEITIGDPKSDLASTIIGQSLALGSLDIPSTDFIENIVEEQTKLITGNDGGFFVIHDGDGDGKPDEALFMDTADLATASLVLRINKSGIGFSNTGYNGPYETAWTLDGTFNAKFITAGTMAAERIKGGILSLGGPSNGNGAIYIYNNAGTQLGKLDNTGLYLGPNNEFYVTLDGTMHAKNGNFDGTVRANQILTGGDNGYITGSQIGSGTVRGSNIGSGTITGDNIGSGTVTGGNIKDYEIGNSKITDGAVTEGKLGGGSVTNSKLGEYSVNNGKLATDAVNNRCIQSASIKTSTLQDDAVSEAKCDATVRSYFGYAINANDIFSGKVTAANGLFTNLTVGTIRINGHVGSWKVFGSVGNSNHVLTYS